uniref:ATP synthase F0 subunit 8 n=1 Tax=Chthamalus challengeri TaxID=261891 RepID=A0A4Y5WZK0_CHTCH|nr:ATP synthase F0 subunit 8 [Chthamalus challengeri]QDE13328.1 ATP synthase F0 subunit 8 [Chthamalus challengeri]
MPHMSPIMWAFIMIMTFSCLLILLSMIYFNNSPLIPDSDKMFKESLSKKWLW